MIASARSKQYLLIAAVIIGGFVIATGGVAWLINSSVYRQSSASYVCFDPVPNLQRSRTSYLTSTNAAVCRLKLEKANTDAARIKGLSDRKHLPYSQGMLFVYDTNSRHCIWMKDMNFALDLVWVNESKEIVKILPNIAPETFPASFCNEQPAKYVIEVNATVAKKLRLEVGQKVTF